MKQRPGRKGRRPIPRGTHRATPIWMPLQPPAEDVRLIGTPIMEARPSAREMQSLYGPYTAGDRKVRESASLNWVQLSSKGLSVN